VIAEEYSCRALTNPQDKLPALSAIAASFNEKISDKYFAGTWFRWFHRLLAGRSLKPETASRPKGTLPSWSWASLDGEVEFLVDSSNLHMRERKSTRTLWKLSNVTRGRDSILANVKLLSSACVLSDALRKYGPWLT
jgi:hypothetical protein